MFSVVQTQRRSARRATSFTDQAAWGLFGQAESLETGIAPWLALQCAVFEGALAGAVVVEREGGAPLQALWPEGEEEPLLAAALASARTRQRGVLEESADGKSFTLAYPLVIGASSIGAVAVQLLPQTPESLHVSMRHLQWGMAWLRERLIAERMVSLEGGEAAGRMLLDMLAAALEPERFEASARAVTVELAERFRCDRVSLGIVRRNHVAVAAISHSASFGKEMNLVRLLGAAMDEAVDQRAVILAPAPDAPFATRAHEALIGAHGAHSVLTAPMHLRDGFIGAITLERGAHQAFSHEEARLLDTLATALAPVLEEKRLNDRPLPAKAWDAAARQVMLLLGPRQAVRKAIVAAAVALVLVFTFWRDTYRVTADAAVEGQEQRAMAIAFDGFLREAPVRAGDLVREGDLMAALDDRDLVLERLKWSTERQRRAFEYEKALGERNRSELRLITNQIEQADAQIALIDAQLARARITAPFDGLVVSGDHSQAIGAAVQRGQVLFELAPSTGHRIALQVDETQVAALKLGQTGRLVLAALPGEGHPVEIVRITPVAKAEEGRNLFRVEARPIGTTDRFRPGMRGVAKIEIDSRRVIWIWSRSLIDWLRLALWRWAP